MTGAAVVAGVALMAAAGAIVRWRVCTAANGSFPWGTLMVNVTGAFALALLAGSGETTSTVIGTGLLGSFTTFSTVMAETRQMAADGRGGLGGAYLAVTFVAGVGAALAGLALVA